MKILIFILALSFASALLLFNVQYFGSVSKITNELDKITTQLELRGRQRYVIQKHYTDVQSSNLYSAKSLERLLDSKMFDANFQVSLPINKVGQLIDWKKWHKIKDYLVLLKEDYPRTENASLSQLEKLNLKSWTGRMVDTLDEIQQGNVQLAHGLNQLMNNELARIVSVNFTSLVLVFFIIFGLNYRSHKKYLRNIGQVNQSLVKREQSLISSKNALLSLLEDLTSEKNEAITLSHQLEDSNVQLRHKNADMEQFIYTVSHDLKSPLVTIGGFTKILEEQLGGQLNDDQIHKLNRISENVKEMGHLLSDLLEISKVLTTEIDKNEINIKKAVEQQWNQLEGLVVESNATLEISGSVSEVFANPRLFGQCIANLLSNAIYYKKEKAAPKIVLSSELKSESIEISICDNGVGIDSKYHSSIFNMFEKLSSERGTGIGLAIIKAIMEKHGGEVTVSSRLGIGSCFKLIFPISTVKNGY